MFRLAAISLLAISLSTCGGSGLFGGSDCVSSEEYARAQRNAQAASEKRYDEALTQAGLERVELPRPEYGVEEAHLGDWAVRATESGGQELVASSPGRLARDAKGRYHVIDWSAEPLRERTLTVCGCDPGRGMEHRAPSLVYRIPLTGPAQFGAATTIRTPIDRIVHRWEHEDGPPEMGCHMAP